MSAGRRPSITEINNMNKDTLKKTLKGILKDLDKEAVHQEPNPLAEEDAANVTDLLSAILEEVKELRKEKLDLKKEVEGLKKQNQSLLDATFQHQRFLEAVDAEKRNHNLIVTGVPEGDFILPAVTEGPDQTPEVTAKTDQEKISLILDKTGQTENVTVVEVKRLGKKREGRNPRPRAIKVVTTTPEERKLVLENSKELKQAGNEFSKIYIKKDIHPAVRKELNRLRSVQSSEKQKPENVGREVKYHADTRFITVDGVEVDRFRMCFF